MKHGSVIVVDEVKTFDIKSGIDMINNNPKNPIFNKDRLRCFVEKGISCSFCKLKANAFSLELIESSSYNGLAFNLYFKSCDKIIFFTKDHIVPKSKGGVCDMSNYQTMCWP